MVSIGVSKTTRRFCRLLPRLEILSSWFRECQWRILARYLKPLYISNIIYMSKAEYKLKRMSEVTSSRSILNNNNNNNNNDDLKHTPRS